MHRAEELSGRELDTGVSSEGGERYWLPRCFQEAGGSCDLGSVEEARVGC